MVIILLEAKEFIFIVKIKYKTTMQDITLNFSSVSIIYGCILKRINIRSLKKEKLKIFFLRNILSLFIIFIKYLADTIAA
jgi:hypothetical protein